MLILLLLYTDALVLTYLKLIHLAWYMWIVPLWFPIAQGISNSVRGMQKHFWLILPLVCLWVWLIVETFIHSGAL